METLIKIVETTVMKLNQYEWDPALDILGKGAFAEVFRAKDQKGNDFALKIYTEAIVEGSTGGSSNQKYTLEKEYEKGKLLSHTNVIRYCDFDYLKHVDAMQRNSRYPVLIMEYADEGSLSALLRTTQPDTQEAIRITREILNGLGYLHSQGIIHRDLKPGNILLKKDRLGRKVVKISDFGISRDLLEVSADGASATAGVGTVEYMAPEQLQKRTYGLNGEISERTDLWAIGIILYRMLAGRMPFGDVNKGHENTYDEIINKEPDYTNVPVQYQAVAKACLQKHASSRPADADAVIKLLDAARAYKEKSDDDGHTNILPDPDKDKKKKQETPLPPKPSTIGKYLVIAAVVILGIVLWIKFGIGPKRVTDKVFKDSDSIEYTYTGPVNKNDRPEGIGKAIYIKNSFAFSGEFKNGDVTGWDTITYNTKGRYIGSTFNGRRNGQGTFYFPSNEIYRGGWVNDDESGHGIDSLANGDKYDCEYSKGKRNGYGTFTSHTGEFYKGEWKDGLKDGNGTWIKDDKEKWSGAFRNGLPNGWDTVVFKNTDVYIGYVKDGSATGRGTKYYYNADSSGDRYEGDLVDGVKDGQGTYFWKSGGSFDGQWKSGVRDGQGVYTDPNGYKYSQSWQKGQQITN